MKLNKEIKTTLLTLGLAAATTMISQAAISITNHSFEDDVLADGAAATTGTTGWVNNGSGHFNPQDAQIFGTTGSGLIPGGDGSQVAFINFGPFYQNIGTIEANSIYELTVAIGARRDLSWANLTVALRASSETGTVLASQVYVHADAPVGSFTDVSFSFDSNDFAGEVGNDLFVTFSAAPQPLIDNVRVTETLVPEPSTTALLGLGGLALILRRRK